ncbi:MAG: aminoglycoside phosphotransferase family protein [Clostridiales bacterium]|nr:aminoglycoside phosphotransferase family protein [Clostridiales bacterium]
MTFDIEDIYENYDLSGEYAGYYVINNGHINSTFVIDYKDEKDGIKSYVLQHINTHVFKKPDQLMENITAVSDHLRKKILEEGGDPERENLNVIKTKNGATFFIDAQERHWRLYNYISDSYTCQRIEDPKTFYNAAKAFGHFQCRLADFPIQTLHETIPNFHHTVWRFENFKESIEKDVINRVKTVKPEIDFAFKREEDAGVLLALADRGQLPLRVTHNDTKLNNVMFDVHTDEGICVIDLDTVMPGLSLYDFGDSIRFGANTAEEDEKDISKVSLDLELYETYVSGYLASAGKSLNELEIECLPFSAKLLTFECGLRFLTDYLDGDVYFKTAYDDHNLVRCRTQFALVEDIEKKMPQMVEITQRVYKEL